MSEVARDLSAWKETRPVADIKPYERNPRKISEHAIEALSASIAKFGWQQPIVVDADNRIVAGHVRLEAAKALSLTEVPVHVAANLTPDQIKEYRLTDNRTAELTDWDLDLLAVEVSELEDLPIGWTQDEADLLMALLDEDGAGEEPPPEEPPEEPGAGEIAGQEDDLPPGYVVIRLAVPRQLATAVQRQGSGDDRRVHVGVVINYWPRHNPFKNCGSGFVEMAYEAGFDRGAKLELFGTPVAEAGLDRAGRRGSRGAGSQGRPRDPKRPR